MDRPQHLNDAKAFTQHFLRTAVGLLLLVGLFVGIVDPNNTLHLSPPLDRAPSATNQRFSYPSIARSQDFNSIIIGTSTTRMLNAERLSRELNVKLANLSMNAGTWWEQMQILKLFLKHHETPKLIIWGMDQQWCTPMEKGPRLTPRRFPVWLYDENKWNDYLHILNFKTIERAARQVGILLQLRQANYGKDGYRSLNKKGTPYDLRKARSKIYGQSTPIPPAKALTRPAVKEEEQKGWSFPNLRTLNTLIAASPKTTKIVLMFVPYHQHYLRAPNGRTMLTFLECKKRVWKFPQHLKNVEFIDFTFRNKFTSNDSNYWDEMHFNERGARIIENALINFIRSESRDSLIIRLSPTQ